LKILQIIPSISLIYGGPSQMVRGLSAALAEQGVYVTILTTNSNGDFGQLPLSVPLAQPIKEQGYEVIYFNCSPFRRYKFSLGLLNWLWHHGQDYDLAHIHALFSPISTAAATLCRLKKLPYILRPLGTLDPLDLRKKQALKKIYGNLLERPNLQGAAAIHFTTQQEADVSERYGTNTPELILPLGVTPPSLLELEPFPLRVIEETNNQIPTLLFLSRIDPKKGLELLISALENLKKVGINFHFILAGSNPQDPDYEQQILTQVQASTIATDTAIAGFVEGQAKWDLLKKADLLILPSYYENFGIVVAEAMAVGTPVLISDQVYIWPTVKAAEAGWICSCNLQSLTEQIQVALKDPQELKRRGQNAQRLAGEQYTWPAIAAQTITTYQSLLQKFHQPEKNCAEVPIQTPP
jgi:glycosyltransferase involved in cell wall biosynthesis